MNNSGQIGNTFRSAALPLYFIPYKRLRKHNGGDTWAREHMWLLLLVAWPALGLIFGDAGSEHAGRLTSLILVDFLILEAILAAWRKYDQAADALDLAMSDHGDVAEELAKYLKTIMAPIRQGVFCVFVAIAFCLAVFAPRQPLATQSVLAYLTCISTGLIVGQALYLNISTLLLARRVRDLQVLPVNSIRPRQSLGIAELSRAVQVHAKAGLVLVAAVMVPVTIGYLKSKSNHELEILLAMASLGPVSVVAIGFTAQMWVYEPARRKRDSALQEIAGKIETDFDRLVSWDPNATVSDLLPSRLQLLRTIEEDDVSIYGRGTVLQYFLIALPILAQVAIALIKLNH